MIELHKYKQLILHLRLWKWAAVHSPDFKAFELSYSKIIRIVFSRFHYVMPMLTIEIQLYKPHFYLFEPPSTAYEFCRINDVDWNDLYPENPF